MAAVLEIVTDNDETIDLDRWSQFAKVEGRNLIVDMKFGTPIIGTDTEDVVAQKKAEQEVECDKFLDAIEEYAGKSILVIYNAVNLANVHIPLDGGLVNGGNLLRWRIADTNEEAEESNGSLHRPSDGGAEYAGILREHVEEIKAASEMLREEIKAANVKAGNEPLRLAIIELTNAINGKRKS